jgi:DNA-binding transcriptional ArsR family regulator
MSKGEHLNLDDLRLAQELVRERTVVPQRIKKRHRQFVQLPLACVDLLARNSRNKTFAVLCHLFHLSWKQGGGPIRVPNGFLEMLGVKPDAKSYALNKLESLGIISVERRDNKSPIVTINDKSDAANGTAGMNIGKSPEDRGHQ